MQGGDVVCCYAGGGTAASCSAPDDCSSRLVFACDEDADCGSGNTCCFTGSQTYCADSCDSRDSHVCGSQSCPASAPTCQPSGFPMFGTCTP